MQFLLIINNNIFTCCAGVYAYKQTIHVHTQQKAHKLSKTCCTSSAGATMQVLDQSLSLLLVLLSSSTVKKSNRLVSGTASGDGV